MATINVAFFVPHSYANYSVIGPVRASENVTSSGTSAQSTNTARGNEICLITPGGDIYVKVGANPTAVAGDLLLKSGLPASIYVPAGEKVAVIDA